MLLSLTAEKRTNVPSVSKFPTTLLRFTLLSIIVLSTEPLFSQIDYSFLTEQPAHSVETHGIETIQLSGLSVDLRIPVRRKSGLLPWSMVLDQRMAYSTSFGQYSVESDTFVGSTFRPYIEGLTGSTSIYYDSNGPYGGIINCPYDTGHTYMHYSDFAVVTSDGGSHDTEPGGLVLRSGSCPHGGETGATSGTIATDDGSGYTLSVDFTNNLIPVSVVYDKDGNSIRSATPTLTAGTGSSVGTGTAWTNPAGVHSTGSTYASITIAGTGGNYQALTATNYGFSINYKPARITSNFHYYATGTVTNATITAQLLKNGVPIGAAQSVPITASGSSSNPVAGPTFFFQDPELSASDINGGQFGVQLTPGGGQSGATLNVFIQNVTITPDPWLLVDRDGNARDDYPATSPTAGETCQNYPYPYPCYFTFKYIDTTGNSPMTILGHTWEPAPLVNDPRAQCQGGSYFSPGGNCVNNGSVGGQIDLPDTLSYADASGNMVSYSITYTTYNFLGNFGCPNGGDALKPNQTAVFPTKVTYPDGGVLYLTYEQSFGKDSTWTTGRLKTLTLPTGGLVTYAYSGGSNGINCIDGSPATMTRTTSDGTTTYTHTPGTGIPAGAGTTTVTDAYGNTKVYTFLGAASSSFQLESQLTEKDSSGTTLRTTTTCYNGVTSLSQCLNGPWQDADSWVDTRIAEVTKYVTDNLYGITYKHDTTYDYNGSVLSDTVYDWGTSPTGSSTVLRKTTNVYGTWNGSACIAIGNYISDRPCDVTIVDGAGNVLAETHYTYNSSGDKTSESAWTGSTWLTTSFQRNSNGTISLQTAPNLSQTQFTYNDGCGGNYLTQKKELSGAALETDYTVDCNTGNTLTITDANTNIRTYDYITGGADPLLRVKAVTDETGAVTTYSYGPASVESSLSINGGVATYDNYTRVDGYGRPWLSQVLNPSSSWDTTTALYDAAGRPAGTVLPCASAKNSACSGPATATQYDALSRVISQQDAGGGYTATSYKGKDTVGTDGPAVTVPSTENLKSVQYERDALSRLTSVCELTSGGSGCGQTNAATGFATSYTRTSSPGSTTLAVSQGVQARNYTFDALNRLTAETNPENGSATYIYDVQSATCGSHSFPGLLAEKVLNDQTHICYQYDTLGRTVSIGNNKTANCSYFVYDVASSPPTGVTVVNGKGRLVEQYTTAANCGTTAALVTDEWFSYDGRGRITNEWEKTPSSGVYFGVGETYYENGIQKATTFTNVGSLSTISYGVDAEGRPYSVSPHYVNSTTYNPNNQPLTIQFSNSSGTNGDYDTLTYDANTNRMLSATFTIGTSLKSIVNAFTWNPNSSLQQVKVTDPFYAVDQNTCMYSHDDLGRLSAFNCGSAWAQTFTYDRYGNLSKSGSQSWACVTCYDATTNRYNTTLSSVVSYDSNGNVLNDGLNQYTWDSYGRMATLYDGTSTHAITYDAQGREVEKTNPTREVVWGPTGKVALMSGPSTVSATFIPLSGGSTLNISSGTAFVRHANFNSTTTVESNLYNHNINSDKAFAPFGEVFAVGAAGNGDTSFTGMTQDTSAGAYDFEKRKLISAEGRWVNPDPAGFGVVRLGDPQTWNRYAYVGNTPESLSDPLGLTPSPEMCVDGCFGAEGGGWFAAEDLGASYLSKGYDHFLLGQSQDAGESVNNVAKTKPAEEQNQEKDGGLVYTPRDMPDGGAGILGQLFGKILDFLGITFVTAPRGDTLSDDPPVPIPLPKNLLWIDQIVNGHGWDEHGKSSDYASKEEYKQLILETVQNAQGGEIVRNPEGRKGVTGFWNDKEGFVVWHDKNKPGQGTAFRPDEPDVYKKRWGFE